ncbi:2-oxo-4-hydroxy-4-carboxy-5-ureidoimidazoline decarboxylase [Nocardia sp. NPDC051030]|uniref:2-oxo-4-hydroxy-4-carboxy-5-ureidoimidazoline decarboxylase n=1 Tax=Nocardia sp. NPDC051030 TaxID=3155162 RepID=UPI003414213E
MTDNRIGWTEFALLTESAAAKTLLTCCSSPAWAQAVAARRPYSNIDELLIAADAELTALSEGEVDRALAGHPRIGERTEDANSAREQAGMADADDAVRVGIAVGNEEYEAKFGHVYLVCASGRTSEELLAVLMERIGNDAETERRIVRQELGKINRIRLRRLLITEDA